MDARGARDGVIDTVDDLADELISVSHAIHARPELAFEEHFACELLVDALERRGVEVERSPYGMETAFVARAGREGPNLVICCEYDALPGIGHACGHNVIAAAGLGAGLALAAATATSTGRITVVGTPAEERRGGKILLLERGAFADADVAMMVHPAGVDFVAPRMLAMTQLDVRAHGREAHAAGFPWRGRNALDAIVMGYTAVAALRQHIRPTERIHGIITRGGDAPNIVPKLAAARFNVRAVTEDHLEALQARVLACFQGAAVATGCELEHRFVGPYTDLVTNNAVAERYETHARELGREFLDPRDVDVPAVGSTDMGNVSKAVPSIHPMIAVAPRDVPLHTEEFARHAVSEHADRAVVDGAKALALTALDLWADTDLLAKAREEFEARVRG